MSKLLILFGRFFAIFGIFIIVLSVVVQMLRKRRF